MGAIPMFFAAGKTEPEESRKGTLRPVYRRPVNIHEAPIRAVIFALPE